MMIHRQSKKQQAALLDDALHYSKRGSSVSPTVRKRPGTHVPTSEQIPASLRDRPCWVGWREAKRRTGKPAKLPINPATGHPASPTDPSTWGTFDAATTAAIRLKLAGVGRVIVPGDGLSVLDLDGCRDRLTGQPDPWAADILDRFRDSYAEVSPSGTGYRAVVAGHPPAGAPCRVGPVELYTRDRYLTFTGWRVDAHPVHVAPAGDRLRWLADNYLRRAPDPKPARDFTPIDFSDAELLARATAHKLTGSRLAALLAGSTLDHRSQSEADYELARLLGFWCGGDADRVQRLMWTSEAVRDKWSDNKGYLARTVNRAIGRLSRVYTPPVSQPLPPTPTREDTGVPLRPPTISEQASRLVEHIRALRRRHGEPISLSARQAASLIGSPPRTAARRLAKLVQDERLILVSKGQWNHSAGCPGPASEFDLPEFAPKSPPTSPNPSAKPTTSLPYTRTPRGLIPIWRWSPRHEAWQHFGDCPARSAGEVAGRLMSRSAGWWSVGSELRHFVRGRGLRVITRR